MLVGLFLLYRRVLRGLSLLDAIPANLDIAPARAFLLYFVEDFLRDNRFVVPLCGVTIVCNTRLSHRHGILCFLIYQTEQEAISLTLHILFGNKPQRRAVYTVAQAPGFFGAIRKHMA